MPNRHALYATVESGDVSQFGSPGTPTTLTFRVGQPTTLDRAMARWKRLWEAGAIDQGQHAPLARARVRHARRWYRVRFMEVRAVDRHGRGLGAVRHETAMPVPCRAVQRVI